MRLIIYVGFLSSVILFAAQSSGAIPSDAGDVNPIGTGNPVPAVEVVTPEGVAVPLRDIMDGEPTVLVFYRGGWCPYCNTQLSGLAEVEPRLRELGYGIIALSADRPEKVAEATRESDFDYRLFSDASMRAAKSFGVAFLVDDETFEMLQGHGIDLESASGEDHRLLPVPAVFLIDADGVIRFRYYNPDYRERISGEALLNAADEALREKS